MADIDVVKKGSRMWLWAVIVLVIVLALWFLMNREPASRVGWQFDEGGRPQTAVLHT